MAVETTPEGSTTRSAGRWSRKPERGLRLLAGVGPPVAVTMMFLLAWTIVSDWPDSPTGDTNFLWMPFGAIVIGVGTAIAGSLALAAETTRRVLVLAVVFWVVPAVPLFLGVWGSEGFPPSAAGLMAGCAVVSLTPTLIVAGCTAGHVRWSV